MGNKNITSYSNYLYCIKNDKESTSVNNSADVNLQKLTSLHPNNTIKEKKNPINEKASNEATYLLKEETLNLKNFPSSIKKKPALLNSDEDEISNEINQESIGNANQPDMNFPSSSKIRIEENCSHLSSLNNLTQGANININLNNQYVIHYINNSYNSPQNESTEKISKEPSKKHLSANGKGINEESFKLGKEGVINKNNPGLFNQVVMSNNNQSISNNNANNNNNMSHNSIKVNTQLSQTANFNINNLNLHSFKNELDKKLLVTSSANSNKEPFLSTLNELKYNANYKVAIFDDEKLNLYKYINTIKKLQRNIRVFLMGKHLSYESKLSINNVSNIFKEDKQIKNPPELFKGFNKLKDHRKSMSNNINMPTDFNNTNVPLNLTKLSGESKNNCSYLTNNMNIPISNLNCKFFKLKTDNKLIKRVKSFILSNISTDNIAINENIFGLKEYSNESKIVGLFNHNNEADGIAIYKCHKTTYYLGKLSKQYFLYIIIIFQFIFFNVYLFNIGIFKKNYLNGFGYSKGNNECCYLGEWLASKQHGFGIEVWQNGSLYKGEFYEGKKQGIGTYIWKNGSRYTGFWEKNKMDGYVNT